MALSNAVKSRLLIFLYTCLALIPLVVLASGPKLATRPALQDLSIGLAFGGLSLMALQFLLTARIKPLTAPLGSDIVYYFHRQIGIASFLFILAHPILLFIVDARYLRLLNLLTSGWQARAGVSAFLLLIGVVWMAEFRAKLKIPYWFWKFWHGVLATVMIALALYHIFMAGNYINLPWKQIVWIGYSAILLMVVAYTRVIYPLSLILHPWEVVEIRPERGSVWTVVMRPIGHRGFHFQPGQFAWLTARSTPFADKEHPFSLASSAEQKGQVEQSIKELGQFTNTIKQLKPGTRVYLDGPYGSFSIDRFPQAENLIMIPGGIGITPIMSMLRTMAQRGDKRPILLLYANREWETVTFREEIAALETKLNLKTVYVLEKPHPGWQGEGGFLNAAIFQKYLDAEWKKRQSHVFLCGPAPMMNAVEKALNIVEFPEERVHSERFSL